MREQIHHETVTPAEWLFCSDGLLPCFRDNETGIRNGPAFFQQARRAPLHGSPMQPACQTAGSPTGRPPRHPQRRSPTSQPPAASGAAPTSRPPRDRSRNGGQTGTAATRRAAVPCALSHNSPEPPRPAVHSGTAPLHNNPRRPAAQPPLHGHPATGHEMADKPAWQPPAGPPSPAPSCIIPRNRRAPPSSRITPRNCRAPPPSRITPRNRRPSAPSCINPPGHQRAPPFPSGKSAYQFPRLALPSPSGKREPAARRAPLRMPDRYIRSVVGPPGARRFAAERGGAGAPKIYYFSSPNTP